MQEATNRRGILKRFAVQSLLLWALGVAPWPQLGVVCQHVFGAFVESAMSLLVAGDVQVTARPAPGMGDWTTLIEIVTDAGQQFAVGWEFRRAPFLSLVTYLALVFGYPLLRLRTRGIQLLLGLAVIPALSLTRIVAMLATPPVSVLDLPVWLETATVVLARAFVLPPGMSYAVPCALWLLSMLCIEPLEFLASLKSLLPDVNLDKASAPTKQRARDH